MSNDHHVLAVKTRHATNNRGIIGESPVAVDFTPVGEDALHIIQRVRTLWMASQLSLFPRGQVGRHFLPQGIDTAMKLLNLAASLLILPCRRFKMGNLLLDLF